MRVELRRTESTWLYQWRRKDDGDSAWRRINQNKVHPLNLRPEFAHLYRLVMNHMLAGETVAVEATYHNGELTVEGFK